MAEVSLKKLIVAKLMELGKMKNEVVAQYSFYDDPDGTYSISIKVNGQWQAPLGPFDTASERQRAFDDMMAMMRSTGAIDLPSRPQ